MQQNSVEVSQILKLLLVPRIGSVAAHVILGFYKERWGSLEALSSSPDFLAEYLSESQISSFYKNQEEVENLLKSLEERNIRLISYYDSNYPRFLLKNLGGRSPLLLSVLGNTDLLEKKSVGFCGSRKASEKGLRVAYDCAEQLANLGVNVVSGYASGVDAETHKAALMQNQGTTAIILPEGILNFRVKRELKNLWDWSRVVVVSEFLPHAKWSVGNAMQRNKTICGLSSAMILIEARTTGGSIAAGRDCLRMGLPLFAAIYEGMPETATGNQELLGQGAIQLAKSRSTQRANIKRVLRVIQKSETFDSSSNTQLSLIDALA
jgi:DNA processing protein